MTTIFDGREFARKKEQKLKREISALKKRGVTPRLVSILVGNDPASTLYVSLKKKAAERIGCEMKIEKFSSVKSVNQLIQLIKKLNKDKKVHGIMVQLPLPKEIVNYKLSIVNSIALEKDVDGLRENSPFVPAAVRAVLQILDESRVKKLANPRTVVVGASGMVGRPLMKELKIKNYELRGYDIKTKNLGAKTLKADILISATGVPELIKGDMVKNGAVVIDVGSPVGDVRSNEVVEKASFITPVPGGVGPVTISCLLENLVIAAEARV